MARILALIDRLPDDPEWKGAFAWGLIRSLCESQHEVRVLSTEDLSRVDVSHPRLTLARPAKSWSFAYLPKFLQATLMYQPEVLLLISPKAAWQLKGLTIWPYLHHALSVLPKIQRYSVLLESEDTDRNQSVLAWHQGVKSCVVFTSSHRQNLRRVHQGEILISPFEMEIPPVEAVDSSMAFILVPAPVSEWLEPVEGLKALRDHLLKHPYLSARINGGWGSFPAGDRRSAWQFLMPVADRLQLLEPLPWSQFIAQAKGAQGLWLSGLAADSWRDVVARFLAQRLGKNLPPNRPALASGSTANFLSRAFAGTFEPWPTL